MSIYLKDFTFPTDEPETKFLWPPSLTPDEVRRCVKRDYRARNHNKSIYPFQILSKYNCQKLFFSDITILFGENGCGKSTALNVMAEKLGLKRETRYNSGRFFPDYLEMCNYNLKRNQDDNYKFKAKKYILSEIFDWFGKDIQFLEETEDEVVCSVYVNEQSMRKWAMQYALHVKVLSPQTLVEAVKNDLKAAMLNYEES